MIGILCSDGKERRTAHHLYSLLKKWEGKNIPIIIFTISNIDFKEKEVTGRVVSRRRIRRVKMTLPSVILNFSLQRRKDGIRNQRFLAGMKDITLVNEINRFDQCMIMEMLSISGKTAKYLLPYKVYNKDKRDFKPDDDKGYIAMPVRGSSLSRVIYARPDIGGDKVIGSQYFRKGHIRDYIDASLCQKRWIFMELTEDILTLNNQPVVIRNYLQRTVEGEWMVLGKSFFPIEDKVRRSDSVGHTDEPSLTIINRINRYIPSLGYCYIDFMISTAGNPYLLHFGGVEKSFLYQRQTNDFYRKFLRNLIHLGGYYNHMQKEV